MRSNRGAEGGGLPCRRRALHRVAIQRVPARPKTLHFESPSLAPPLEFASDAYVRGRERKGAQVFDTRDLAAALVCLAERSRLHQR